MTDQAHDDCELAGELYPIKAYEGSGWFDARVWLGTELRSGMSACWRGYVAHYRIAENLLTLVAVDLWGEADDQLALERAKSRLPIGAAFGSATGVAPVRVTASGSLTFGKRWLPAARSAEFTLTFRDGILVTPQGVLQKNLDRWRAATEEQRLISEVELAEENKRHRVRDVRRTVRAEAFRPASAEVLRLQANPREGTWFDGGRCPSCGLQGRLRVCEDELVLCRECYTHW